MTRRLVSVLLLVPVVGAFATNAYPQAKPATRAASRPVSERERWNEIFSREKRPFNTEPNAFLKRCLERLEGRGQALDIAMGQGRNAVALARHGFEVTGIDISDVAIAQATQSAEQAGVTLTGALADVFNYDYGRDKWDLISLIYFDPAKPILDRIKAGVKPGGYFMFEGFGVRKSGGPPDSTKWAPNEMLEKFRDWHILEYQDGEFEADWAGRGKTHVVRMLAQRPHAGSAGDRTGRRPMPRPGETPVPREEVTPK